MVDSLWDKNGQFRVKGPNFECQICCSTISKLNSTGQQNQ